MGRSRGLRGVFSDTLRWHGIIDPTNRAVFHNNRVHSTPHFICKLHGKISNGSQNVSVGQHPKHTDHVNLGTWSRILYNTQDSRAPVRCRKSFSMAVQNPGIQDSILKRAKADVGEGAVHSGTADTCPHSEPSFPHLHSRQSKVNGTWHCKWRPPPPPQLVTMRSSSSTSL